MSKRTLVLNVILLVLLSVSTIPRANASAVIDVIGKTVAIYDDDGNFKEAKTKQDFLNGRNLTANPIPVLQKNDNGLLLIDTGSQQIWIGEDDVKLDTPKQSIITCVDVVRAKTSDTVAAAAMGLGGCPKK